MDETQKTEFAVTVSAMFEAFGQEATRPRLLGYWLGLQDLSLESIQRAVGRAVREFKRLPAPAEVRELAGVTGPSERAVVAWSDVLKAVPRGPYKHIDFEDRVCNAVIRTLGGWPTFFERFCDAESEKWARLDFLKTYQSLASVGVDSEAAKPLPGLCEVQVINGGIMPSVPVRIRSGLLRLNLTGGQQPQERIQ